MSNQVPSPALPDHDHDEQDFRRIDWLKPGSLGLIGVHLAALMIFFTPFAWKWVGLCLALYFVRMFGITGGYHRYFSHRSFQTSRAFQLVLALLGISSMQKGPLWWGAVHRHHHRHSDQEPDYHSPSLRGFFWAHLGWVLCPDSEQEADHSRIADFAKYPELRWLDRWHAVPGVVLAVVLFLVGGLPALAWGFFASTVLVWHCTFAINSLTHMMGTRRYPTTDNSRNSLILALVTLGEGWHNNHHYYKASTRQGFFWWEIDITYYLLRLLAMFGIVWGLKEPPRRLLETGTLKALGGPAEETTLPNADGATA